MFIYVYMNLYCIGVSEGRKRRLLTFVLVILDWFILFIFFIEMYDVAKRQKLNKICSM